MIIVTDISGADISESIENNITEYFLYLGHINGSEVFDKQNIKYVFSDCGYNRIMWARFPLSEAGQITEQIVTKLDELDIGVSWYLNQSSALKLHSTLIRYGFTHLRDALSMALDLTSFSASNQFPDGLCIRIAVNEEDLDTWAKVVLKSNGINDNAHKGYGKYLTMQDSLKRGRYIHYLGLLYGRPVASVALFKGTSAAGIYWVGTLPEARGRGVATAMMNNVLRDAKDSGYKVATLNSSTMGHPIYLKMGFKDYFTTNIYQRDRK